METVEPKPMAKIHNVKMKGALSWKKDQRSIPHESS